MTNKEYANLIVESGAFDESMRKHFENSVLYAEPVSAGVLSFDKPHLKRRFCYGYGYGVDRETAQGCAKAVRSDYNMFLDENLDSARHARYLREVEKTPEKVYLVKIYGKGNFVNFVICDRWKVRKDYVPATADDVEIIKDGLKAQVENLTKRCATYWKKYGGRKLDTWSFDTNY